MRMLITGACGFVGSQLATALSRLVQNITVYAADNLCRPGSELNRRSLSEAGIQFIHTDLRSQSDVECLPAVDWVIDAAANPSVLAGIGSGGASRSVLESNLFATVNLLEYCKRHHAGFVLLSTSRVYSIARLSEVQVRSHEEAFVPATPISVPHVTDRGIAERFSTEPPLSVYGCTKLCSEQLALEYGSAFDFPVWINRCGVMAGAGQFGRADQGIFAYWLHSWREKRPLRYIGFGGNGHQVRDCLHPRDLLTLILRQMETRQTNQPKIVNVSGGLESATSLARLSAWCERRWGPHDVGSEDPRRPFDLPWVVLDSTLAAETWGWRPLIGMEDILTEIASFAEQHCDWLRVSQS